MVQRNDVTSIEAFFEFTSTPGSCLGIIRLVVDGHGAVVARNLMTTIDQLATHSEKIHDRRPMGKADASTFGGPNWLDRRNLTKTFEDHDPQVLIVGGG